MAGGDKLAGLSGVQTEARRGGESLWRISWRRFRRKKLAMAALGIILIFYLAGIFAPVVAPYNYTSQNLEASFQGPTREHLLGTDRLGRDLLSRLIWGARTSTIVSVASIATGTIFFGIVLGALAGFIGRWVDTLIMRVGDIFLAFPGLLLVILIASTIRPRVVQWVREVEQTTGFRGLIDSGAPDYFLVFGALSLFGWVGMARLIRGQILSLKEREFILAAKAMGASTARIILVHLLPNTISLILVMVSMGLGGAIGSELVLSWLGVGIQPPTPSLGVMIWENQSQSLLVQHPHVVLAPIILVMIVFFAFNILGDGLNDALNPRAY